MKKDGSRCECCEFVCVTLKYASKLTTYVLKNMNMETKFTFRIESMKRNIEFGLLIRKMVSLLWHGSCSHHSSFITIYDIKRIISVGLYTFRRIQHTGLMKLLINKLMNMLQNWPHSILGKLRPILTLLCHKIWAHRICYYVWHKANQQTKIWKKVFHSLWGQ